jgi:hypothetical protein
MLIHLSGPDCNASNTTYERLSDLWKFVLCKKPTFSTWHKRECLLGECVSCGVHRLRFVCKRCHQMHWWIGYEIVGFNEDGIPKKTSIYEYKTTKPSELIQHMKSCLQDFIIQYPPESLATPLQILNFCNK